MRSLYFIGAFAIAAGVAMPSVNAAPPVMLDQGAAGKNSLVTQAHYWHRYCSWGPARYHRHVPGVGNVPCHDRPYRDGSNEDGHEENDDNRKVYSEKTERYGNDDKDD